MALRAASITRGGSGRSGLDADDWRRILTSNSFGTASSDLSKDFIKKLCSKRINSENKSLEAFIPCRLIPLNKNTGLRPIGVGEVLCRIAGKVAMKILKKDVMHAAGLLQVCDWWEIDVVIRRNYSRRSDIYGNIRTGVTPLLHFLHEFILINEQTSKEVAFADDLTVAGNKIN